MPRMKKVTYAFGEATPETFREVVEDVVSPVLSRIDDNTGEIIPELKRTRLANELILGQEVDVPED